MPTWDTNSLPSTTGIDHGSPTQRWDEYVQDLDVAGTATYAGTGTFDTGIFGLLNNIAFIDGTKYAATAAGIQAAIDALPSTGGIVWLPRGNTNIGTGLTITKNVWLRGHGKGFDTKYGSQLTWTGTGGTAITVSGSNVESMLSDFSLENTGTGAVGIDIDGVTGTVVDRVNIYPQGTGFSTTAIRIGQTTNTVDVLLRDVYVRNNAVGVQAKKVTAHLVFDHVRLKQNTTNDLQLGSGSDAVTSFHAVNGSLFEGAANTTSITIHRAISAHFDNCYFEHDGSGYALDIPSTAAQAFDIVVDKSFFSGAAFSNTTTYATNVNLSIAQLTLKNSYFAQYANPGYPVRNQAYAKVVVENCDLNFTGAVEVSGSFANVTVKDNTVGNVRVNVDRYPGQAVFQGNVQLLKLSQYNSIATVSNGVPSEYATVDLTAQTAAVATTTLYAVPAAGAGQYRVTWNAKVTTAATTGAATSTLGALTIVYTDPDSVVQTITAAAQIAAGTIATTSTGNSTTTVLIGLPLTLNCKASTNITYAMAYASDTANQMAYNLHIKLEAL